MRVVEIITERMSISWVRPWVERSVPKNLPRNDTVDWFSKLFKSLNNDPEFKQWASENVVGPISIKPKLIEDPSVSMSVLDAEHVAYSNPAKHEIVTTVNIAPEITDNIKLTRIVNRLSARLTHELNHAHQVSGQFRKAKDQDAVFDYKDSVFSSEPPKPKNNTEDYYLYMLNSLEKDAWASEFAQDIKNSLGNDSAKNLNSIFKQIEKEEYAVIGSKIINLEGLNGLYSAIRYYNKYLKMGSVGTWQKVKKEIYGYITR